MSRKAAYQPPPSGFIRRSAHSLYGLWFGAVFSGLALTALCLIAVAPGQQRRRRIARYGARAVFALTAAWPNISGLRRLPDGPAIVVANHASYLDGILLTAVLPEDYRFVIKREVTQVPLVNFFLNRIGAHFVERFDKQRGASDARRIMQTADEGASLAFFPEGTFHAEPGLRRFHNGAFKVATRGMLPLVPLAIRGTREMLPADRILPRPARLEIMIDDPLLTDDGTDLQTALQHCRTRILSCLDEPDLLSAE